MNIRNVQKISLIFTNLNALITKTKLCDFTIHISGVLRIILTYGYMWLYSLQKKQRKVFWRMKWTWSVFFYNWRLYLNQ